MFGTPDNPLEEEPQDESDRDLIWFENLATGEMTEDDPRMIPELLKKRGVDIQQFKIL
ncbi:hypothetical protein WAI453_013653 [Rhynchosporium graminicola]